LVSRENYESRVIICSREDRIGLTHLQSSSWKSYLK
jgi:hypothetical protein